MHYRGNLFLVPICELVPLIAFSKFDQIRSQWTAISSHWNSSAISLSHEVCIMQQINWLDFCSLIIQE